MAQSLPKPPEAGVFNAFRFGTQTFRFLEGIQSRFDDGIAVPIPGRAPLVVITNPTLVREALSRPEAFRRVPAQAAAALIAENGLVQSEGDLWRQQRSIVQPAFTGRQVEAYANTTGRRVERLAADWRDDDTTDLDLHGELTTLTIRVASEILLGEDIGYDRAKQFHEWMRVAGEEFEFGLGSVAPEWLPNPPSPAFKRAAAGIRGLSEELIERRRATLTAGDAETRPRDMLTALLVAEGDPEVEYPPNQIRDEVATFLIAGHETTALSLTYTLSVLSWHPDIRNRVRDEATTALDGSTPGYDDLEKLPFTRRVYDEALRLYPPAWAIFRRTNGDIHLGEYTIPDRAAVIMPLWSIHRDSRYFDGPTSFDPDRWERREPSEVDAYLPFSVGPHACIGQRFALSGATLSIARLVREFDIDVPSDALDDLRVTPTLRPGGEVSATVRRRQ